MFNQESNPFHKDHPFKAAIKERKLLNLPGSNKKTYHIVLDLTQSGITYQTGDSLAVIPINHAELVEKTLNALRMTGMEEVIEKNHPEPLLLQDFLTKKGNITEISRKLMQEFASRQTDQTKREKIENLLADREGWKTYQETHELWDVLLDNPEVSFKPDELIHLLMPVLPRFYSISSAQSMVGEEVHLTVALLNYSSSGHLRRGVCTHYLCELSELHTFDIPVYIQPHHGFTLPENDDAPMIMIGPGTGIAPFRAFMQERIQRNAKGKNWLFFGEWNRAYDFFYQDFWEKLAQENKLRIDCAFSRDQDYKIYVQHLLQQHATEIFQWLKDGAYLFVCGDAHRMAKDVDATLLQIVIQEGKMTEADAKLFIKNLRSEKRYLRDVY